VEGHWRVYVISHYFSILRLNNFNLRILTSQKEETGDSLVKTCYLEEFSLFWCFMGREGQKDELADQQDVRPVCECWITRLKPNWA
jgi:hypothetical protein